MCLTLFHLIILLASIPVDDSLPDSSLLPKGFKPQGPPRGKSKIRVEDALSTIQQDDVSRFLPPGFRPTTSTSTTEKSLIEDILASIELEDVSSPIPPSGFVPKKDPKANPRLFKSESRRTTSRSTSASSEESTASPSTTENKVSS